MRGLVRLRRRARSEDGAELIEFSLTLPLLLLVVLGIIEFGFLFQEYEVVTNAAREGARVAVLPHYSTADAQARVTQYMTAGGLNPARTTVLPVTTTSLPVGGACVAVMNVGVEYTHPVPFLSGIMGYFGSSFGTITLRGNSSMRVEAGAAACP
jgi:Flp pilus assembly protein TadG